MLQHYNLVFEKEDDWWIASVVELPGALSQGRTLEEARDNILDAIRELLLARRQLAEEGRSEKEIVREELELDLDKLLA